MTDTQINEDELKLLVHQLRKVIGEYLRARIAETGPSRVINYTVLNALATTIADMLQGASEADKNWFLDAVEFAMDKETGQEAKPVEKQPAPLCWHTGTTCDRGCDEDSACI